MKPLKCKSRTEGRQLMKNPCLLLLLAIPLALVSCGTTGSGDYGATQMSESRHFPKSPSFTIKPGGTYPGTGLDFNSVYYAPPLRSNMPPQFNYMRFWSNGRVLVNTAGRIPTRPDAENFANAYLGYYRVANSNIVAEFYIPTIVPGKWDYMRELLAIQDGNVMSVRQEMNGQILESRAAYQKLPLGQLQRLPDW
jgi:hypothetical protein